MEEIKADIKEIKTSLLAIVSIQERNTTSLEHHMERTELNEKRIEKIETWVLRLLTGIVMALVAKMFIR